MPFKALGLHPLLLKAIQETGYTEPTPIQAAAIPEIILGCRCFIDSTATPPPGRG